MLSNKFLRQSDQVIQSLSNRIVIYICQHIEVRLKRN